MNALRTSSSARAVWLGALAAVLVAALAFVVAGTAPAPPQGKSGLSRTTAVARHLVCAGGLARASAEVGVAGGTSNSALTFGGPTVTKGRASLRNKPLLITSPPKVAAAVYAVRTAQIGRWFAADACPSPRSDWWFVGAGGSQAHHSTLLITNPLPGNAVVDVHVFGPKGVVAAPGLDNLSVNTASTLKLNLADVAPSVGDLAVHVEATRGLVTASAPESWSPDFVAHTTGDWVADQPAASRKVTLAGVPAGARTATALIANPGTDEAVIHITMVGAQGTYSPTKGATVRVPPQTVRPVVLTPLLGTKPAAFTLTSNVPIAATVRSTAGTDSAYAPTLRSLGSSAVVGIPTHLGPAALVLVAGNLKGRVSVVGYGANGKPLGTRVLSLPARASLTTALWPRASAVRVTGAGAAGGVVVLGTGRKVGLAVIGLTPSASESRVPPVAPALIGP